MQKQRNILYSLLILVLFACPAEAAQNFRHVSLMTYYPAPQGAFDYVKLLPRAWTLPCEPGIVIRELDTDLPLICVDDGSGNSRWGMIADLWEITNDHQLYPSASQTNPNILAGLGTTTPAFRLTLDSDGGIFTRLRPGTPTIDLTTPVSTANAASLFWYPKKASFRAGHLPVNETDSTIGNWSVNLGFNNVTQGDASGVLGGLNNQALANYSVVLGGETNYIGNSGTYSTIAGGQNNQAWTPYTYIYGANNAAYLSPGGNYITIAGGQCNFANYTGATIAGGSHNQENCAAGVNCCSGNFLTGLYMTIGGGTYNKASGDYSTVTGGYANTASGAYTTITGGSRLLASHTHSTMGGGALNSSGGIYSVVAGGSQNNDPLIVPTMSPTAAYNTITGGSYHFVDGQYSTVSGGHWNIVRGNYSNILGGEQNILTGNYSTISGGILNRVHANYSFVHGNNLTLLSGVNNKMVFWWNPGAATSTLNDTDIFLIENSRFTVHDATPGNAVMSVRDDSAGILPLLAISRQATDPAGNVFLVKANGHISIGEASPPVNCVLFIKSNFAGLAGCIDINGQIYNPSSREYKTNINKIDRGSALEALQKMKPVRYRYKSAPDEKHFGFIAEDVPDMVATPDRKGLNPMDITAMLTSVVQEQQERIADQRKVIDVLKSRVNELEAAQ